MPDNLLDATALSWLASGQAMIELDRELVRRGGLRMFVELAWHVIEPVARFVPNWHIDEICNELEAVIAGRQKRLAMAVPPRHAKSTILAVMFPVYVWMKNPAARMMFISYDFALSIRDSKRTRELVNSAWFQERWGDSVQLKTDNTIILETTKTGYRECVSVGGRVMGKGADIICLDDPHDVKDVESDKKRAEVLAFWRERVQSRLNDPKTGTFIVCHQRVGESDLIGDILKTQRGRYTYLCLPAKFDPKHPHIWPGDPRTQEGELLWPEHMPQDVIDGFEKTLFSYAFACNPGEAPILMADLTMKRLDRIKIGDEIIGFSSRCLETPSGTKSRLKLVKTVVLDVQSSKKPVVKIKFKSGLSIRCTPDHKWFTGKQDAYHELYEPAKIRSNLLRVCSPEITLPSTYDEIYTAGWLGGFFDGEGSTSLQKRWGVDHAETVLITFTRGSEANLSLCDRLESSLKKFNIEFGVHYRKKTNMKWQNSRIYWVKGNKLELAQKFLHVFNVEKWRDRIERSPLTSRFIKEREKVVSIEPDGEEVVYGLTTGTKNYIAWGLASSNSQYQQLPGPREGGLFKRVWFPILPRGQVPGDLVLCRGWDFAATVKSLIKADPDWTATVLIGFSPSTKKYYIMHVDRWRVDGGEVNQLLLKHARIDTSAVRIRLPQDPGAAGKTQAQSQGSMLSGFSFVVEPVTGDKAVNAAPLAGQAMIGNVALLEADWNEMFVSELTGFPTGSHDDMVDAAAQAFKGFIVTTTGILDYYTQMMGQQQRAATDAALQPGHGQHDEETSDMGRAFKSQF